MKQLGNWSFALSTDCIAAEKLGFQYMNTILNPSCHGGFIFKANMISVVPTAS
jgi:hypothetical protein